MNNITTKTTYTHADLIDLQDRLAISDWRLGAIEFYLDKDQVGDMEDEDTLECLHNILMMSDIEILEDHLLYKNDK